MNCGKTFTPPQEPPFLPRAYKYVVWQMPGEAGEGCTMDSSIMHQSILAGPSPPPRATCGHLPALSVPGVGNLQILHCPGAGHLPTPGPLVSFWHSRSFLSEYNYTAFTGKNADQLTCQGRKKLKRVVKACSRFYACISSLLIKPELHSEIGAIDVKQRILVFESNFCWYYLMNILSHL